MWSEAVRFDPYGGRGLNCLEWIFISYVRASLCRGRKVPLFVHASLVAIIYSHSS
jgi:hypothetical protein